jgi:hypothetical protein
LLGGSLTRVLFLLRPAPSDLGGYFLLDRSLIRDFACQLIGAKWPHRSDPI